MAKIYDKAYFNKQIGPVADANLSIASSAVLYGLSVYTVFYVYPEEGRYRAFRLQEHYTRLKNSAKIIGLEWPTHLRFEEFEQLVKQLIEANSPDEPVFVRATIHADGLVPGTRSPSPLGKLSCSTALIVCGLASRSSAARSFMITMGNTLRRESLTRSSTWCCAGSNSAISQPLLTLLFDSSRSVRPTRKSPATAEANSTLWICRVCRNPSIAPTSYGGR